MRPLFKLFLPLSPNISSVFTHHILILLYWRWLFYLTIKRWKYHIAETVAHCYDFLYYLFLRVIDPKKTLIFIPCAYILPTNYIFEHNSKATNQKSKDQEKSRRMCHMYLHTFFHDRTFIIFRLQSRVIDDFAPKWSNRFILSKCINNP